MLLEWPVRESNPHFDYNQMAMQKHLIIINTSPAFEPRLLLIRFVDSAIVYNSERVFPTCITLWTFETIGFVTEAHNVLSVLAFGTKVDGHESREIDQKLLDREFFG